MSEKVKVSREVAEAIEQGISTCCGKDGFLTTHARIEWDSEGMKVLNNFSTLHLAEILIAGYEIKQTPEETILTNYQNAITKVAKSSTEGISTNAYWRGYRDAIKVTVDILGITIPGINGGEDNG